MVNCGELYEIRRINENRIKAISQDDIIDLKILIGLYSNDSKKFLSKIGCKPERNVINREIAAPGMPGYNR
jgi:hypothetical protein